MYVTSLTGQQELLTDFKADSVEINRKIEGDYSLSFTILPTEKNAHSFPLLVEDALVTVDNENFVIKSIGDNPKQKRIVAIHEFFDVEDDFVDEVLLDGLYTIQQAMTHAFSKTQDWTFNIVGTFPQAALKDFGNDTPVALLQIILATFEAEFNVNSQGKVITLVKRLGLDMQFQIRHKHNLVSIKRDIDASQIKTAVRVFYNPHTDGSYGSSVVYESPNKNMYRRPKWAKSLYVDANSQAEALAYAKSQLNDTPTISIACEFVSLQSAGYNSDEIALGNSFYLIDERLNEDSLARVVELTTYPYSNRTPKLTFANRKKSMANQVLQQKIEQKQLDRQAVKQRVIYNGCTITPENGFKATANNGVVAFLNATKGIAIINGEVYKFYVNTEGELILDGKLQITDGGVTLLEGYKDDAGGVLKIYDSDGLLNVLIGSNKFNSEHNGGVLKIYADNPNKNDSRIELMINDSDQAGEMILKDQEGNRRIGIYAATWGETEIELRNADGSSRTVIVPGFISLNGDRVVTKSELDDEIAALKEYIDDEIDWLWGQMPSGD